MTARIISIDPVYPEQEKIIQAAAILKKSGLVAFPTETVYGLGALALDPIAVRKVFFAKSRPASRPLIIHVSSIEMAKDLVDFSSPNGWSETAEKLALAFWPGPLTLILRKSSKVPLVTTGGNDTVAVRMPAHPVAQALIMQVDAPIAAPSANPFTRISPTSAQHVWKGLQEQVDFILDAGKTTFGVESTIVDLTSSVPRILRPGSITWEQIHSIIGNVSRWTPINSAHTHSHLAPGLSQKHYSPSVPVELIPLGDEKTLLLRIEKETQKNNKVGLLLHRIHTVFSGVTETIQLPSVAERYAQDLYQALHELEDKGCSIILLEDVPASSDFDAVRDRIQRSTGKG